MEKHKNEIFVEKILKKYRHYMNLKELEHNEVHFLNYLVAIGLLQNKMINRFVVLELYPEVREKSKSRESAFCEISAITEISRTAVYNIIKNTRPFRASNYTLDNNINSILLKRLKK